MAMVSAFFFSGRANSMRTTPSWISVRMLMRPPSKLLKNSGRAHAGSHAHRHHPVLQLMTAQRMYNGCGANSTGGAKRMSQGNRSPHRVDDSRIQSQVTDHGKRLRGKRLVQFDPAQII